MCVCRTLRFISNNFVNPSTSSKMYKNIEKPSTSRSFQNVSQNTAEIDIELQAVRSKSLQSMKIGTSKIDSEWNSSLSFGKSSTNKSPEAVPQQNSTPAPTESTSSPTEGEDDETSATDSSSAGSRCFCCSADIGLISVAVVVISAIILIITISVWHIGESIGNNDKGTNVTNNIPTVAAVLNHETNRSAL